MQILYITTLLSIQMLLLTACAGFDYVSRGDLDDEPEYIASRYAENGSLKLGALRFNRSGYDYLNGSVKYNRYFSLEDAASDGGLLVFQRDDGRYFVETLFLENKKRKYFFSIGFKPEFGANIYERTISTGLDYADVGFRIQF